MRSGESAHSRELALPQFEHPWHYGNDPFRTQSVSWDQETPDDDQGVNNETFQQFLQDIHQHQNNLHPTDQAASLGHGLTQQLASTNFDLNNQSKFSNACTPLEEADDDGRLDISDCDIANFSPYLAHESSGHIEPDLPSRDTFDNSYVWIVHTNSIHHLALVSCRCCGPDSLPLDLIMC